MRTQIFPATWDAQQREGEVIQIVDEAVNGVRVVKAFGQERRELERVTDASEDLYGSQMRAVRLTSRYQPLLQAIPALGQVAILAFGGWLALHGEISLGTFLAFTTYVGQLVSPTRQLAGLLAIGQQARAGVERIFQLLDLAPGDRRRARRGRARRRSRGEIDFDDVELRLRRAPPTSSTASTCTSTAGERVAIVGPSGSGKSTATLLVSRFYEPDRGAVLVDGHDVRGGHAALAALARSASSSRRASCSPTRVRANIAYGRPEASDAEIEAAARVAQAHDFVDGAAARLRHRRRRARPHPVRRPAPADRARPRGAARPADPDPRRRDQRRRRAHRGGDQRRRCATVLAGRTTLLVAHRRSTLHLADRVVVLDEGRVVDQGTHDELAERSAVYRGLLTGLDEDVAEAVAGPGRGARARVEGQTTAAAWSDARRRGRAGAGAHRATALRRRPASAAPRSAAGSANRAAAAAGRWRKPRADPAADGPGGEAAAGPRRGRRSTSTARPRHVARLHPAQAAARVPPAAAARPGARRPRRARRRSPARSWSRPASTTASPPARRRCSSPPRRSSSLVTLADLVDEVGETFVTGRTAQRVMLSLRIRIWAQLQRLALDYYEREMAGRIMTRMTTDVDQFEVADRERPALGAGRLRHLRRRRRRAAAAQPRARRCATLAVVVPLAVATVVVPPPLGASSTTRRATASRSSTPTSRRASPACASRRRSSTRRTTERRFRRLGGDYLESRVGAQRLVAIYFPFVQFLSVAGRRDRARRRRRDGPRRAPDDRRADRLHPLRRHVLLARSSSSRRCSTPGSRRGSRWRGSPS